MQNIIPNKKHGVVLIITILCYNDWGCIYCIFNHVLWFLFFSLCDFSRWIYRDWLWMLLIIN